MKGGGKPKRAVRPVPAMKAGGSVKNLVQYEKGQHGGKIPTVAEEKAEHGMKKGGKVKAGCA